MNYYERYCGDYGRDTGHLSLTQHGVYGVLLDAQYSTEAGLPGAYESLYRICRAMAKVEQVAVRSVADEFFPIGTDGLRWNRRARRVIAEAVKRIEASRSNGRNGGRPRNNPAGTREEPDRFSKETRQVPKQEPRTNPAETHAGKELTNPSLHKSEKQKPARAALALPDWVPAEAWADFDEMRRAKNAKAWTHRAQELCLDELAKLRAAGDNPGDVLRRSTARSWTGLFPLDRRKAERSPGRVERHADNMDRLTGKTHERTIEGVAERVDKPALFAVPGDLREPDADDVEGRGPGRSQVGLGG